MKAVFSYEIKRLFAQIRTYLYLVLALAAECAAFAVYNFTTGYIKPDKAVQALGIAFLAILPLVTAESFAGDSGMQRTFRSLGISRAKCYFGRLFATLAVACAPLLLTLAVPPMLMLMGEVNMLSAYLAMIGLLLCVIALTASFTAVSVCCDGVLYSYAASYGVALIFYGAKRLCEGIYGADALRALVGVLAPTYALSGFGEESFSLGALIGLLLTLGIALAVGLLMSDKTEISDGVMLKRAPFKIAVASVSVCLAISAVLGMIPLKADLTENGITKLSDGAVAEIKKIDTDTTVYLVTPKDAVNTRMKTILERVADLNEKITVELLDPDEHEATILQYTSNVEEALFGAIIVKSAKRSVYIPYHELYSYSDEAYLNLINSHYILQQSGSSLTLPQHILVYSENDELYIHDGYRYEEGIVEALAYCNADDVKTVYAVGNVTPSDSLVRLAMRRYTEIKPLSLSSKEIPSDCDAILLSLTRDMTEAERERLEDYLDGGGKILASADYGASYAELNALLARFGVSVDPSLILEDSDEHRYNENSLLIYPTVADEALSAAVGTESKLLLTTPTPIIIDEALPEGVTVDTLLNTSDSSYTKGEDATSEVFDPEKDTRGKRAVCVRATDAVGGEIILMTSGYLALDDYEPSRNRACKAAFFHMLGEFTESAELTPTVAPRAAICPTGEESSVALWCGIGVCSALAIALALLGIKRMQKA